MQCRSTRALIVATQRTIRFKRNHVVLVQSLVRRVRLQNVTSAIKVDSPPTFDESFQCRADEFRDILRSPSSVECGRSHIRYFDHIITNGLHDDGFARKSPWVRSRGETRDEVGLVFGEGWRALRLQTRNDPWKHPGCDKHHERNDSNL